VIKASVEEFLGIEERLDVLWNNAGVLTPPIGAITMQVCCIVRTLLSISSH
jgi:retinol dehydrogenase-12